MQEIVIPAALEEAVATSLRAVTALHRKKIARRVGAVCTSIVCMVAALGIFGAVNPALASQIPIIGPLFTTVANHSKVSVGNEHLGEYQVVAPIKSVDDGALSVTEGFSDGNRLQAVLSLDLPAYAAYGTVYAKTDATAQIGGQETPVSIAPFHLKNGEWVSFLEADLTPAQGAMEALPVSLTLEGLVVQEIPMEDVAYSEAAPIPQVTLTESFTTTFTLPVNTTHNFAFSSTAKSNDAQVLGVSGTPIETAFALDLPYWGSVSSAPEDGDKGKPVLITGDGQSVRPLYGVSMTRGGYVMSAGKPKKATFYFDGLPKDTKTATLFFYETNAHEKVLAEFLVDFANQTVTAK